MTLARLLSTLLPIQSLYKDELLHALCPRDREETVKVSGYRMTLDLNECIQRHIYLKIFETRETALVRRHLKPGMIVVDAGANVGYYTLLSASLVGAAGRVFSFEPSPYAFGRLSAAIKANAIGQVTAVNAAVGDTQGSITLYVPNKPDFHSPTLFPNPDSTPVTVPMLRLADFLDGAGVGEIDLLKLDVEGYEPNALAGLGPRLSDGRVRSILIEFNRVLLQKNNHDSRPLFNALLGHGFIPHGGSFRDDVRVQTLFFVRKPA